MSRFMRCVLMMCFVVPWAVRAEGQILPPEAGLPVIDWQDAHKYVDGEVIVQGKIVQTKDIGRITFLNFDTAHSFTAIVREANYKNFPKGPDRMYDHQIVRIRGVVSEFNGTPQIEVFRPEQVRILEQAEPIPPKPAPQRRAFKGIVTLGTFNVYNLFDEYDDPYHVDEGTPAKPKEQLERLAATIKKLDVDVLALEEVENRGYLQRFVATYLPDMGYENVVCIESNDRRGIDCAVLSRLPVGPVTSYRHLRFPDGSGEEMQFRRDLLEARIEPPGCQAFSLFVVHFKSKRGGADTTGKYRLGEARKTREVLDDLLRQHRDALFVICGDFNDTWDSPPLKLLRGEGDTALHGLLADLPKDAATYNQEPHGMIDFLLCSPAMAKRYVPKSCKIMPGTVDSSGSDHNPVSAHFDLKPAD